MRTTLVVVSAAGISSGSARRISCIFCRMPASLALEYTTDCGDGIVEATGDWRRSLLTLRCRWALLLSCSICLPLSRSEFDGRSLSRRGSSHRTSCGACPAQLGLVPACSHPLLGWKLVSGSKLTQLAGQPGSVCGPSPAELMGVGGTVGVS